MACAVSRGAQHLCTWPSLISVASDTCNGCLSAKTAPSAVCSTTHHEDTVLGRRPAPGQHAQGYSYNYHHWMTLLQIRVVINLLSVSYRQSANLQGSSQRDMMGFMMGYRARSQPMGGCSEPASQARGSKLWWWWGTAVPGIQVIGCFSICSKVICQEDRFFF